MWKKRFAGALILCLLLSMLGVPVGGSAQELAPDARYQLEVERLRDYLRYGQEDDTETLDALYEGFDGLGKHAYSVAFREYVEALRQIKRGDYENASARLNVLSWNQEFNAYLSGPEGEVALPDCAQMLSYVQAREFELQGDNEAATERYKLCMNVLDATERAVNLSQNNWEALYAAALESAMDGDYQGALSIFSKLAAYGYKDSADRTAQLKMLLGNAAEPVAQATDAPAAPVAQATDAPAAPAEQAAQAPQAPADAAWSDWLTELPGGVSAATHQVETATQYRARTRSRQYRSSERSTKTVTNETLSGWTLLSTDKSYGSWSGWSDSAASASATLDVETRTVDVTKTVTKYSYSRYEYLHADHPKMIWSSCVKYQGEKFVKELNGWQYKTTSEPLTYKGTSGGCKQYASSNGMWYNEKVTTTEEVTGQKTQYRTRSIAVKRTYEQWSGWSSWENSSISANDNRKVEKRYVWSDWGAWQLDVLTADNDRQVEERLVYRYK